MNNKITKSYTVLEVRSVLEKTIRTHKNYWQKIKQEKHPEIGFGLEELKLTLIDSYAVYQSQHSSHVFLYTRKFPSYSIIAVVRHLNSNGFLITAYQTTKQVKARKKVWQKQ